MCIRVLFGYTPLMEQFTGLVWHMCWSCMDCSIGQTSDRWRERWLCICIGPKGTHALLMHMCIQLVHIIQEQEINRLNATVSDTVSQLKEVSEYMYMCPAHTTHTPSLSLSLSLSLSPSLTHTHTHTLSLSLSHTHTHTHSLSLSHTHTHTHTHTHSLSLSLSLTHTHTHSLSLTHTHTHTEENVGAVSV